MQAMVLAAGFGTRLQPYSLIRPKPLFPLLNRPLLLILLDMARRSGCERVVVNGHHLSRHVHRAVHGLSWVHFQHEAEILGTGGSLRRALPSFDEAPVLVMNGDICHDIDLDALYRHHRASGNGVTMALLDHPRFNTVAVDNSVVSGFHAAPPGGENVLAYTGIQVVEPQVIRRIPGGGFFHIIDLYQAMASEGREIGFMRVDGSLWRDIGTPADYLQLHGDLLSGRIRCSLPLAMPEDRWLISPEAAVASGALLEGWGCIGRARVGPGARLRNCVVWDQAEIPAGACLENRIVTPLRR